MHLQVNEVSGELRTIGVDGDPGEGWSRVVVVTDKKDSVKFDFVSWELDENGERTGLLKIASDSDKSMLLLTLQRGVNP